MMKQFDQLIRGVSRSALFQSDLDRHLIRAAIPDHLRSRGRHVRGGAVLDLILGLS